MAHQAKLIGGFDQVGIVSSAMNVMATETRHPTPVHDALNEIVTLHTIFMAGPVGEMHEIGLAQFVFFKPPEIP